MKAGGNSISKNQQISHKKHKSATKNCTSELPHKTITETRTHNIKHLVSNRNKIMFIRSLKNKHLTVQMEGAPDMVT